MDSDSGSKRPDHVVILVHGMGKALKGGTLQEWAQPLLNSLNDIALDGRDLLPEDSEFRRLPPLIIDSADALEETPNTWIRVLRATPKDANDYARIVITEASWGKDFRPATAGATYAWAWKSTVIVIRRVARLLSWNIMPRAWAAYLGKSLSWIRPALALLLVILFFPLIALGLVVLGLVLVLTPIPGVGRLVGSFISLFADFLGDPETWQRRPLQAAAMRDTVSRAILACKGTAEDPWTDTQVTVLAHSQGAAISAQVIFQGGLDVTNFICVGNGLPLLGYARWGDEISPDLLGQVQQDHSLIQNAAAAQDLPASPVKDWLRHRNMPRWINLWARFDFVPAGPVGPTAGRDNEATFKELYTGGDGNNYGPEEHPIYNSSALIKDHIVYSRNRVEVIDPVAQLIYRDCAAAPAATAIPVPGSDGLWLPPLEEQGADGDARLRAHHNLVKSLGMTRLLAFIAGAAVSGQLLQWLSAWSFPGYLAKCSKIAADAPFVIWPCTSAPEWSNPNDLWILFLMAALIGSLLLQMLNGWIWNALHRRVERRRTKSDVRLTAPGHGYLVIYLLAVFLLTVAMPVTITVTGMGNGLAGPQLVWVGAYVALFAVLVALSLTGQPLKPMRARLPKVTTVGAVGD
ncbi:hypothetical protein ACX80E_05550 [Arthrobacter sp. TMN-49]